MHMLNGMKVIGRVGNVVYVRLPPELQENAGVCHCKVCKGNQAFMDTLAVPIMSLDADGKVTPATYTLHCPDGILESR